MEGRTGGHEKVKTRTSTQWCRGQTHIRADAHDIFKLKALGVDDVGGARPGQGWLAAATNEDRRDVGHHLADQHSLRSRHCVVALTHHPLHCDHFRFNLAWADRMARSERWLRRSDARTHLEPRLFFASCRNQRAMISPKERPSPL